MYCGFTPFGCNSSQKLQHRCRRYVGTRLALNDSDDTSVLAGIAVDLDTQELFLNIEAQRRLGENFSVELQLRTYMNAEPGDALFAVEHDDYLQLRLSWYY